MYVCRFSAPRPVSTPVPAMIEENAAIAPCQRFEVACGAPKFRVAPRSHVEDQWRSLTLDVVVESCPVRHRQEGHISLSLAPIAAPTLAPAGAGLQEQP